MVLYHSGLLVCASKSYPSIRHSHLIHRLRSSVVSVLFSLTTKMTAPRSSLVSQFLPPSFSDLCLHVRVHDDLATAVPACVVRGSHFSFYCVC